MGLDGIVIRFDDPSFLYAVFVYFYREQVELTLQYILPFHKLWLVDQGKKMSCVNENTCPRLAPKTRQKQRQLV